MSKKNGTKKNGHQKSGKRREDELPRLDPRAKRELGAIVLAVAALLALLSFFGVAGPAGGFIDASLSAAFGVTKIAFPFIVAFLAARLAFPGRFAVRAPVGLGAFLLLASLGGLLNAAKFPELDAMLVLENVSTAGGYVGLLLGYPAVSLMGRWAALVVLAAGVLCSLVVAFNVSIRDLAVRLSAMRRSSRVPADEAADGPSFMKKEIGTADEIADAPAMAVTATAGQDEDAAKMTAAVKRKRSKPISIPTDLLETRNAKPSSGDVHGRMMAIRKTLENFGIPVEMSDVSVGPTVTQFTLKPAEGIKLNRITSLSNDLALSLAAHPIRIEAPIPGKSLVGIEVPNHTVAVVSLREVIESKEFSTRRSGLTICLGKDVAGMPWTADLGKMPHMLVAGATGSGKTVCLNAIILSLLFQNNPDDLKLMLIDPKRVELPVYNGIPHLLTPAITEVPKIINALKWAIGEMDRRFDLLSKAGKRDITAYNESAEERLPFIVIVVDELADLMVASAAEVEAAIIRLAQMARAVGIHLVVATQRPSVDVITGLIKANITSRIAFSVASATDSRTILDTTGAEKLVGRGDALFVNSELSKPKRIQCCYVSDKEIRKVVDHLMEQLEEPVQYEEGVTEKRSGSSFGFGADDGDDELFDEARDTVVRAGKASASYLQRRLKVGYARAARLLDLLEERGIIGPGDGAKPRQILVSPVMDTDGQHFSDRDDDEF